MNNNNNIMSNTNKNKPMCVLCNVQLYKGEGEDYQWICSKKKFHKYQLFLRSNVL